MQQLFSFELVIKLSNQYFKIKINIYQYFNFLKKVLYYFNVLHKKKKNAC